MTGLIEDSIDIKRRCNDSASTIGIMTLGIMTIGMMTLGTMT